jgi:hypothetical protein
MLENPCDFFVTTVRGEVLKEPKVPKNTCGFDKEAEVRLLPPNFILLAPKYQGFIPEDYIWAYPITQLHPLRCIVWYQKMGVQRTPAFVLAHFEQHRRYCHSALYNYIYPKSIHVTLFPKSFFCFISHATDPSSPNGPFMPRNNAFVPKGRRLAPKPCQWTT